MTTNQLFGDIIRVHVEQTIHVDNNYYYRNFLVVKCTKLDSWSKVCGSDEMLTLSWIRVVANFDSMNSDILSGFIII